MYVNRKAFSICCQYRDSRQIRKSGSCGGGDRCGGGHGGRSGSHHHGNYQILVAVAVVGIAIFIIVLVKVIEVFVNVVVRVVIKIVAGVDRRCAAGRALNRSGSSLIGPKSIT